MSRLAPFVVVLSLMTASHAPQSAGGRIQDRADMAWWRDSMATRDVRLAWWREARFGMFIHWGVYSLPAGVWEGKPVTGYAEHIQRIRKIPIATYREQVAGRFNPVLFNADAWAAAARRAGMGYMIITAKHHDGFAMYDSQVSDYNIIKATPFGKTGRDPMRELKDACARAGLRFGFYYSHAFDWGEADGPGNDWDYENPGGDRLLHGANWWESAPELLPRIRRYVDRKSIPQVRELIRKYDPDIMWFDTPHKLPVEENLRIIRAAREAKPSLVINGRAVQPIPGGPAARFGDYMSTADRPAELPAQDGDWEAIPTTNESYGHHQADLSHKPAAHFIRLLANAAARGGNLLLNIGPTGDGRIDPKDMAILDAIGRWMAVNGESIRGTERTPLPIQAWGHSTRKGNRLYLHVFDWPRDGRLYVAGLRSDARAPYPVSRVNRDDVELRVPASPPDPVDAVIPLDIRGKIETNPARYVPATAPTTLHVFHGTLVGSGIRYGDGKRLRDSTLGWSDAASGVDWLVRVTQPAKYRVGVTYATAAKADAGAFEIRFGSAALKGSVQPTDRADAFQTVDVGEIELQPGEFTIAIRPVSIGGAELMRLRTIELTPVK
jgi:alpha-L-fucosidase